MANYALYCDMSFQNTNLRNRVKAEVEAQALARGLTTVSAYPGYPAGTLAYTNTAGKAALKFCYTGEFSVVEQAATDLATYFNAGNASDDGVFGTGYIN